MKKQKNGQVIEQGKASSESIGKEVVSLNDMTNIQLAEIIENELPEVFIKAQKALLMNETPRYVIKKRKGRGGMLFDYVDVGYVIEQLNVLFAFNWDWKQITDDTSPEYIRMSIDIGQFIVKGQLVVRGKNGQCVVKEGNGRSEIKYLREDEKDKDKKRIPLDIGNDLKGAWSDCLKKCASKLGIALDIYSGEVTRRQDSQNPEGDITEEGRKRLEVLANEAGIGHSGLKKIIGEMYDYSSTKDIKRKHFKEISEKLQTMCGEKEVEDIAIPEDIQTGFNILKVPLAKQKAQYKAYASRGQEGIEELKKRINSLIDTKV